MKRKTTKPVSSYRQAIYTFLAVNGFAIKDKSQLHFALRRLLNEHALAAASYLLGDEVKAYTYTFICRDCGKKITHTGGKKKNHVRQYQSCNLKEESVSDQKPAMMARAENKLINEMVTEAPFVAKTIILDPATDDEMENIT